MRNMSFALTKPQMQRQTKFVTRRLGWEFLKVGDLLQPIEKGMGLKPGEKIVQVCGPIRVTHKRRERLDLLTHDLDYGFVECAMEGFPAPHPYQWPSEFVRMFCATHKGCTPERVITRIAFEFTEPAAIGSKS